MFNFERIAKLTDDSRRRQSYAAIENAILEQLPQRYKNQSFRETIKDRMLTYVTSAADVSPATIQNWRKNDGQLRQNWWSGIVHALADLHGNPNLLHPETITVHERQQAVEPRRTNPGRRRSAPSAAQQALQARVEAREQALQKEWQP